MKKLTLALASVLVAGVASAADLPRKAIKAVPVAVPVGMNWTGFYAGLNAGYAFGGEASADFNGLFPKENTGALKGFFGGAQLGYDYQINNIVLGLAADYALGKISGSKTEVSAPALTLKGEVSNLYTVRARLGYAISNMSLLYVTGGYAGASVKGTEFVTLNPAVNYTISKTASGYVLGAGYEQKFSRNLSAFVEYRYTTLSFKDTVYAGNVKANLNDVRVGVNYRF